MQRIRGVEIEFMDGKIVEWTATTTTIGSGDVLHLWLDGSYGQRELRGAFPLCNIRSWRWRD